LVLAACDAAEPEAPPKPERAEVEAIARPAPVPEAEPLPPGSPQLGVEVSFVNVAPLHRGFFGEDDARAKLGRELAGKVSDPAKLAIAYDNEQFLGTIQLELVPDGIQQAVRRNGDTVTLGDLAPITVALANYRSDLAARFDYRIQSFRVRLFSVRGLRSCIFDITGLAPPDGRTISPCVIIDGIEHCGQPGAAGVSFEPDVARDIAVCLDID
jgi:hypothetical protein